MYYMFLGGIVKHIWQNMAQNIAQNAGFMLLLAIKILVIIYIIGIVPNWYLMHNCAFLAGMSIIFIIYLFIIIFLSCYFCICLPLYRYYIKRIYGPGF
jgi:ABC-type uncharacterized transport system permease subunit